MSGGTTLTERGHASLGNSFKRHYLPCWAGGIMEAQGREVSGPGVLGR